MNQIYDRVVKKYLIWLFFVPFLLHVLLLNLLFFAEFVSNLTWLISQWKLMPLEQIYIEEAMKIQTFLIVCLILFLSILGTL